MNKLWRKIKKILPDTDRSEKYYYFSKNYYYEKLQSKYEKVQSYVDLYVSNSKLSALDSKIQIKPELGSSCETIKQKYGEPYHRLINATALKNQIFFYKFILGGYKTKCEMHFFRNKLFFFNYTFSYLTSSDKAKIIEFLSKKYLHESVDLKMSKITDAFGNEISIHDAIDFVINYLACRSEFFSVAESMRMRDKEETEMKSKLNNKELYNSL
jgi:hypothetical protein